jgi:PAS domain S-box-containing protein
VRYAASVATLALLYLAAGRFGLSLAAMHANVSLVWPPTGLSLAALLLFGYRPWPGITIGAFLVNALTDVPLGTAAGIAVGNTLEALSGVYLLRRFVGFRNSLERLRDVLGFVGLAAGLSTTVSATIGVTSLCLGRAATWSDYGSLWWQWWLGDAMGALVLTPVLLTWGMQPRIAWRPWRVIEAGVLLVLLVSVTQLAFGEWFTPSISNFPMSFYVFPFVIWAALRFDSRAAATVTLVVSAAATWATVRDFGPFQGQTLTENLMLLQSFMSVVAVTGLVLAAAMVQRRRVEGALRASETRLAGILGSAMDAIISVDEAQRIVLFNRAAERMLGWRAPEVLGQPLERLLPARFRQVHATHIARFGQTGVTTRSVQSPGDLVALRADGQEIPIEATISQVEVDGHKIYTVILRDISERKKAEVERAVLLAREQAARAEAEAASRTKDDFLATLSHELRAPLNTILMWSQLLRDGRLDQATTAYAVETIERSTKAQAQIIADLLDVSRIVSGKLLLEMVPVDPGAVARAALEAVRPAALAKGIRLEASLAPAAGPLLGDPNRLQQVLWNLLSNAVKFTPRDGSVSVSLRRADSHLEITVRDSGEGIRPDFLPYLFDRFRQADSSTTRTHGGLGLGLAIVRHLVELHGGTVRAESPGEGQGATFVVRLPLQAVLPKGASPPRALAANGEATLDRAALEGVRVLVVDDEADARAVLAAVLEQCGAAVTTAGSVREALLALEQDHPDVLVSDIGMPGEDGYRLIQRVRALGSASGGGLPAVALTAYARTEDRMRALSAGFQAHLPKPVEPEELAALVADLARRAAPSG